MKGRLYVSVEVSLGRTPIIWITGGHCGARLVHSWLTTLMLHVPLSSWSTGMCAVRES